MKTNYISENNPECLLSVWVSPCTYPGPLSCVTDLYLGSVHPWQRVAIKQCDLNIQMTVLIEENKCSHMAGLAVLSSARGRGPQTSTPPARPRPIWSWPSGDREPTNTAAKRWLLLMPPGFRRSRLIPHKRTHKHTFPNASAARESGRGKKKGRWGEERWMRWVTA